ncbi:hypothetical protein AnigIFM63604_001541 [Aspergillus niger]|uniref:Integral membrane protein n=1 Tax=Aspergillus niger TaxID=5061 RepID=A0A9W5ZZA4_ASPNG|nr:hypothetical protein CBS133816_8536 [Aspergillus niger]KAI2864567.1 hypothetical protein CBS12448_2783 [Aspergillus niger]KAI2925217.1 hypothetical protein CBS147371_775 [Aspergillus niger]KAI2944643.1 hypothetical protein CBS147321_4342 [Aspergillus niger]KAI2968682.1 hypothetical protein CBS147324_6376 [Aspergillus niger]
MDPETDPSNPPVINYILSFLLVGVAWGFTTPFIRRAAADFAARQQQNQQQDDNNNISINSNDSVPLTPVTPEYTDEARPEEGGEESEEDNPPPATHQEQQQQQQQQPAWMQQNQQKPPSWLRKKIATLFWTVVNLLRTPAYSIPLVVNLTGSVWFFLLVGKHELSLTVPLANSSAFLFTVLGEWYVERKVIERETWLGMALVLGGIALCVMA